MYLSRTLCPTRLKVIRKLVRTDRQLNVLDVGCGNHSPSLTKRWLEGCSYTGVDIGEYNLDDEDRQQLDRFILVNIDGSGYDQIPDSSYDVILVNHVIEHMRDPMSVIAVLCKKLRPGQGYIYLAFPSLRSLSLPSAIGTLQFCDDATHIRIPDVREVAQALLDNGVRVIRGGRSFDFGRYLLGMFIYPVSVARHALTGRKHLPGLWQFLGFEDMVLGQRRG